MAIARDDVMLLVKERDEIEEQIKALLKVLEGQKNVGMDEALVDREGYPRNDIDVTQVRHARHQVICLRNDFKQKTKEIEQGLHELHHQVKIQSSHQPVSKNRQNRNDVNKTSFLKIDEVTHGSPSFEAGLMIHDEVLSFGSLTANNFEKMQDIAAVVQNSVDKKIKIVVKRGSEVLDVSLIPKKWSGRGLLGCNMVPMKR